MGVQSLAVLEHEVQRRLRTTVVKDHFEELTVQYVGTTAVECSVGGACGEAQVYCSRYLAALRDTVAREHSGKACRTNQSRWKWDCTRVELGHRDHSRTPTKLYSSSLSANATVLFNRKIFSDFSQNRCEGGLQQQRKALLYKSSLEKASRTRNSAEGCQSRT